MCFLASISSISSCESLKIFYMYGRRYSAGSGARNTRADPVCLSWTFYERIQNQSTVVSPCVRLYKDIIFLARFRSFCHMIKNQNKQGTVFCPLYYKFRQSTGLLRNFILTMKITNTMIQQSLKPEQFCWFTAIFKSFVIIFRLKCWPFLWICFKNKEEFNEIILLLLSWYLLCGQRVGLLGETV